MESVTFVYGVGNSVTKTLPTGTTVGNALADRTMRAFLGYGEKVAGHIGGVAQDDATTLRTGMVVDIHDKAADKGA